MRKAEGHTEVADYDDCACFDRNLHTLRAALAAENLQVGFGTNAITIWRETKALEV